MRVTGPRETRGDWPQYQRRIVRDEGYPPRWCFHERRGAGGSGEHTLLLTKLSAAARLVMMPTSSMLKRVTPPDHGCRRLTVVSSNEALSFPIA